jgi:molecular chaperone GrpE (heat shock protein)
MHIQKQLENVLAENGATEIPTKEGDKFDPNIHEAVESSDKEHGTSDKVHPVKSSRSEVAEGEFNRVKKVLLKGYKLNGKVLRAVKVIVE